MSEDGARWDESELCLADVQGVTDGLQTLNNDVKDTQGLAENALGEKKPLTTCRHQGPASQPDMRVDGVLCSITSPLEPPDGFKSYSTSAKIEATFPNKIKSFFTSNAVLVSHSFPHTHTSTCHTPLLTIRGQRLQG